MGNAAIAGFLVGQGHFWFMAAGLLFEINFIRGPISQRLVEPFVVIKLEVSLQMTPGIRNRCVLVKVNFFVFYSSPEALNKNIVEGPAAAVHADSDVLVFQ